MHCLARFRPEPNPFRIPTRRIDCRCVLVAVDRNLQMRRFEIARGRRGVSLRKVFALLHGLPARPHALCPARFLVHN